jgi:protein-L-isoaspartate(D-aspartate) O-methyltransferase
MHAAALSLGIALACLLGACASSTPRHEDSGADGRDARRDERERMVAGQIAARGVRDPAVLAAMAAVPREWFVPPELQASAYDDAALPIAAGQTISQPYIVALMTEALALQPGARVLEIGTGSGYQAAVLAQLTPHVYSIEYVPALAESARATLAAHGLTGIALRQGDGYGGWPDAAPFDAILVAAAPPSVPQPLIDQLRPGGRLCIPIDAAPGMQELLLVSKQADGSTTRTSLRPVRFVPMLGEARKAH